MAPLGDRLEAALAQVEALLDGLDAAADAHPEAAPILTAVRAAADAAADARLAAPRDGDDGGSDDGGGDDDGGGGGARLMSALQRAAKARAVRLLVEAGLDTSTTPLEPLATAIAALVLSTARALAAASRPSTRTAATQCAPPPTAFDLAASRPSTRGETPQKSALTSPATPSRMRPLVDTAAQTVLQPPRRAGSPTARGGRGGSSAAAARPHSRQADVLNLNGGACASRPSTHSADGSVAALSPIRQSASGGGGGSHGGGYGGGGGGGGGGGLRALNLHADAARRADGDTFSRMPPSPARAARLSRLAPVTVAPVAVTHVTHVTAHAQPGRERAGTSGGGGGRRDERTALRLIKSLRAENASLRATVAAARGAGLSAAPDGGDGGAAPPPPLPSQPRTAAAQPPQPPLALKLRASVDASDGVVSNGGDGGNARGGGGDAELEAGKYAGIDFGSYVGSHANSSCAQPSAVAQGSALGGALGGAGWWEGSERTRGEPSSVSQFKMARTGAAERATRLERERAARAALAVSGGARAQTAEAAPSGARVASSATLDTRLGALAAPSKSDAHSSHAPSHVVDSSPRAPPPTPQPLGVRQLLDGLGPAALAAPSRAALSAAAADQVFNHAGSHNPLAHPPSTRASTAQAGGHGAQLSNDQLLWRASTECGADDGGGGAAPLAARRSSSGGGALPAVVSLLNPMSALHDQQHVARGGSGGAAAAADDANSLAGLSGLALSAAALVADAAPAGGSRAAALATARAAAAAASNPVSAEALARAVAAFPQELVRDAAVARLEAIGLRVRATSRLLQEPLRRVSEGRAYTACAYALKLCELFEALLSLPFQASNGRLFHQLARFARLHAGALDTLAAARLVSKVDLLEEVNAALSDADALLATASDAPAGRERAATGFAPGAADAARALQRTHFELRKALGHHAGSQLYASPAAVLASPPLSAQSSAVSAARGPARGAGAAHAVTSLSLALLTRGLTLGETDAAPRASAAATGAPDFFDGGAVALADGVY